MQTSSITSTQTTQFRTGALVFPFPCKESSAVIKRALFLWDSIYISYTNGLEKHFDSFIHRLVDRGDIELVDLDTGPFDEVFAYGNIVVEATINRAKELLALYDVLQHTSPEFHELFRQEATKLVPFAQFMNLINDKKIFPYNEETKAAAVKIYAFAFMGFALLKSLELSRAPLLAPNKDLHIRLANLVDMCFSGEELSENYTGLMLDMSIPTPSSNRLMKMSVDQIIEYRERNWQYRDLVFNRTRTELYKISEMEEIDEVNDYLESAKKTIDAELNECSLVRDELSVDRVVSYLSISVPTLLTPAGAGLGTLMDCLLGTSPSGIAVGAAAGLGVGFGISAVNAYAKNRAKLREFKAAYPVHYLLI